MKMETSDHVPCVVKVSTNVPKGSIFRFENYWMEHDHFLFTVQHGWSLPTGQTDKAKIVLDKFKNLRRVLKAWHSSLSSLKENINNITLVLSFLEVLEECKDMSIQKWNFRDIFAEKLVWLLLKKQKIYWKQRGTVMSVKFGDAGTKFFHANSTIRHRGNLITELEDASGNLQSDHHLKYDILWEAYKDRLGVVEFQQMIFDLTSLMTAGGSF